MKVEKSVQIINLKSKKFLNDALTMHFLPFHSISLTNSVDVHILYLYTMSTERHMYKNTPLWCKIQLRWRKLSKVNFQKYFSYLLSFLCTSTNISKLVSQEKKSPPSFLSYTIFFAWITTILPFYVLWRNQCVIVCYL